MPIDRRDEKSCRKAQPEVLFHEKPFAGLMVLENTITGHFYNTGVNLLSPGRPQ